MSRPACLRASRAALLSLPLLCAGLLPAAADEVEDALQAALSAYQAGDVALAKEEAEFASQLLAQMKAEGLGAFLPAPMEGWTREEADAQAAAAMFGGGAMSAAEYLGPEGQTVSVQMMADNPMVASMAGLLANPAAMGAMGKVVRVGRQKAVVTPEGDVQALVGGRVMVSVEGDAPEAVKLAYFEAIDFAGLAGF